MCVNNKKISKVINILVFVLILIQPLLDVVRTTYGDIFQVFSISLLEIPNIILVLSIFILTYLNLEKDKRKKIIYLFIVYVIYLILHFINGANFKNNKFDGEDMNFFKETYYILRVYIQPVILMICVYLSNISKKSFYLLIKILILLIAIIMIVSNVFGISYVSYSNETKVITGNIFSWFNFNGDDVLGLTSKGLFYSANQLSNLLFILFPIMMCIAYTENKKHSYILLLLQIISMIMIGTKTASLGWLLLGVLLGTFLLVYNLMIRNKDGLLKTIKIIAIFALISPIFIFSPLVKRYINDIKILNLENKIEVPKEDDENDIFKPNENEGEEEPEPSVPTNPENEEEENNTSKPGENEDEEESIKIIDKREEWNLREDVIIDLSDEGYSLIMSDKTCQSFTSEEEQKLIEYMNKYSYFHRLNKVFIEYYPIETDFEFWCNVYRRDANENSNSRYIKTDILSRIVENNNNAFDYYLGIGYSIRTIEMERDYYQQFYLFGVVGLLLLVLPYVVMFIIGGLKILKNIKKKFTIENIFFMSSMFSGLAIAYFSGHFYAKLFVMLIYSVIVAMGCKCIKDDE